MIAVHINDEQHKFKEDMLLLDVMTSLKIAADGVAIAIDKDIVPKCDWDKTTIKENDNILIIKATQGG